MKVIALVWKEFKHDSVDRLTEQKWLKLFIIVLYTVSSEANYIFPNTVRRDE